MKDANMPTAQHAQHTAGRITKRHIGLECTFRAYGGYEGRLMPGRIASIKHGIAKVDYSLIDGAGICRGRFAAFEPVNSNRVRLAI